MIDDEKLVFGVLEPLPPSTYAIMVHRLYTDRVKEAMLLERNFHEDSGWNYYVLPPSSSPANTILPHNNSKEEEGSNSILDNIDVINQNCMVIATPELGKRKARTGYALLILKNTKEICLSNLSPLARQNISWGCSLSHKFIRANNQRNEEVGGNEFGKVLLEVLSSKNYEFDLTRHILRVDTYPKTETTKICYGLQYAASTMVNSSSPPTKLEDCFDGPIQMTKSKSKCTHILSIISSTDFENNDNTMFLFGVLVSHSSSGRVKFNDEAAQEVYVEPTNPNNGLDLSSNSVPMNAPVSRAYYKLSQVYDEILCHKALLLSRLRSDDSVGLDLGSSPGGWTQVLRNQIGVPHAISIDPGRLANRVLNLSGVQHIVNEMSSTETAKDILDVLSSQKNQRQISMVVCDASMDNHLILPEISKLLQQMCSLASSASVSSIQSFSRMFMLPSVWVITLKLPYKTLSSIERNIKKVKETIPKQLSYISKLAYGSSDQGEVLVQIRYKVVHLMANSDSERTLIVIFDEQKERGGKK